MTRTARKHNNAHLDFIRSLPCICCGDNTATEAAHIRSADASLAKSATGIGIKPDDFWTLPLCSRHHREQHEGNERQFWQVRVGIDPFKYAMRLFTVSGDYQSGLAVLKATKQMHPK
jgi:hypothetical protein